MDPAYDILQKVFCGGIAIGFLNMLWYIRLRVKANDLGQIAYHEVQAAYAFAIMLGCAFLAIGMNFI